MIRINLLPVRQVRRAQASRRHLLILGLAVFVEMAVMFFVYERKEAEVETIDRRVQELRGDITRLKSEVGDFDKLKGQRDRLLKQRQVINTLHKNRMGPVAVLREISDILTEGKGPTVNPVQYEQLVRRDPLAGFNARWNPNRVWVLNVDQRGNRLRITGKAKDHDDVAEFLKRLQLSRYFANVKLTRDVQGRDNRTRTKVIEFALVCTAQYKV